MGLEKTQPAISTKSDMEVKKKILIVSGSPRKKGNTIHIVNILLEKMQQKDGNFVFDHLYLKDKNLKFCLGCLNCLKRGGEACPLNDDKAEILAEMHTADGLIFACPGYSHQVTAMFKNFLDRFMYLDHIPEFIGIPTVIISTVDYDGAKVVPKYLANMGFLWWGCNIVGKLGVAHALFTLNSGYRDKIEKQLEKISGDFAKGLYEKDPKRPSFTQYISFLYNKFETEFAAEVFPARYQHWRENGWLDKHYYYDTKIPYSHALLAKIALGMAKRQVKKDLGKNYKEQITQYYNHSSSKNKHHNTLG